MPNPSLEIQSGPEAGKRIEIPPGIEEILLGRSPECAIVVAAPSVSRKHARLVRLGDRFRIEDLGSANGTQVNGNRVESPVEVGDQDRITLGSIEMLLSSPPSVPPEADATIAVPPGEDATIAVSPRANPAQPSPDRLHEPPSVPAPPAPPNELPRPWRRDEAAPPSVEPNPELTPTRPTPGLPASAPRARAAGPGIAELVAIGVASFLAVYVLGWLLG